MSSCINDGCLSEGATPDIVGALGHRWDRSRGLPHEGRARAWLVTATCVSGALLAEIAASREGCPRAILRATFLDVGPGDAAIVDLPDGNAIIIDGGGLVGSPVDVGARVVAPELRFRRRHRILTAIPSHPHPDHFSGLATGLSDVQVGAVWDTLESRVNAREQVDSMHPGSPGDAEQRSVPSFVRILLCGVRSLGARPWRSSLPACPSPSSEPWSNDNSLVVRISFGRRAILFVGDAERDRRTRSSCLGPSKP